MIPYTVILEGKQYCGDDKNSFECVSFDMFGRYGMSQGGRQMHESREVNTRNIIVGEIRI